MTATIEIRRILGIKRAEVAHLIRYEMGLRGYTQRSLGRAMGISDIAVCKTVNGHAHSARILDKLIEIGIPEAYLFDPRRVDLPDNLRTAKHTPRAVA